MKPKKCFPKSSIFNFGDQYTDKQDSQNCKKNASVDETTGNVGRNHEKCSKKFSVSRNIFSEFFSAEFFSRVLPYVSGENEVGLYQGFKGIRHERPNNLDCQKTRKKLERRHSGAQPKACESSQSPNYISGHILIQVKQYVAKSVH